MRTWGTSESVSERYKKISLAGPGYSTREVPIPAEYVETLIGPKGAVAEIRMHSGGLQVDVRPPLGPGLPHRAVLGPGREWQLTAAQSLLGESLRVASSRHVSLQSSFRHEKSELEAAMMTLERFHHGELSFDGGLGLPHQVDTVVGKFSKCNLSGLPCRPNELICDSLFEASLTPEGLTHRKSGTQEPPGFSAAVSEILACTAALNFYRWLCGLQPVQLSEWRHELCDLTSKTLVPRTTEVPAEVGVPVTLGALEFHDAFAKLLAAGGISVLHGEASLIAAVEQSLGSTHMLPSPRAELPPGYAERLARQYGETETQRPGRGVLKGRVQMLLTELPPSLSPMRVFWDLQVGNEPERTVRKPRPGRRSCARLSTIWGDRHGALNFRRCLLNPALQKFAAARRQDTCILWTGAELDESVDTPVSCCERLDAVCFPPTGLVPMSFLHGGRAPWTIMPDSTKFQPTAASAARAWWVIIEGRERAERGAEIPVRDFAVDCSTSGEPFCVIFWPDIGWPTSGDQIEVQLSGLCGPSTELTFFYEFCDVRQQVLDRCLLAEAAKIRSLLGDGALWPDTAPVGNTDCETPEVERLSHPELSFVTNSVDVAIMLRSPMAAALCVEVHLLRFGGEEEDVPHAAQAQRLPGDHFFITAKMPMARTRYELRLAVSKKDTPEELHSVPWKYMITTGDQCQMLLTSLEDPLRRKFGLAPVTLAAQLYGVVVLAPLTRRIMVGQCYFLVYVDQAVALSAVQAGVDAAEATASKEGRRAFSERAAACRSSMEVTPRRAPSSRLFSSRLVPPEATSDVSRGPGRRKMNGGGVSLEQAVGELYKRLHSTLAPHTQDTARQVHLDVALRGGDCVFPLQERLDFPNLYEGLVNFGEADALLPVSLFLRVPLHATEYAPRRLAEWLVCRVEHFPINF